MYQFFGYRSCSENSAFEWKRQTDRQTDRQITHVFVQYEDLNRSLRHQMTLSEPTLLQLLRLHKPNTVYS